MTQLELYSCLEVSPLLRGCPIDPSALTFRACQSGQIISDRQEGSTAVGMVVSGIVDVYSVALDGRDIQLNALNPGDCFGICNLLVQEEMETVLRCRKKTELIFIPKTAFIAAMEQDPSFAMRYASFCNQKIQFLIRRIELLTMQSCRGKVIEYLLSQKDESGTVRPDCSREDLARRLGVSRAALFRELSALNTGGYLKQDRGNIRLLDPEGLTQILFQS